MKGPFDNQIQQIAPEGEIEAAPSGKVWQRMAYFCAPRGLTLQFSGGDDYQETVSAEDEELAVAYGTAAESMAAATAAGQAEDETAGYEFTTTEVEDATEEVLAPEAAPAPLPSAMVPRWRSIGPIRMDNGQTYGDTRISVSGRVSSLAVDPGNRNHILCGSAAGGVWRSTNGGTSWSPRTDFAPTLAIGAIVFDPNNRNIVYVGTGEGNFYRALGQGILRSTNNGASFSLLTGAPFVGAGFYDLIVDPGDSQRLIAATTRGIYVSTDGGSNWTRTRAVWTWDLTIAPPGGNNAEILAACQDGLFSSTDGGANWTEITLPSGQTTYNRMAVDYVDSSPGTAYVFAAADGTAYLWRRATARGRWSRITLPTVATNQAWYDWFVAAAPDRVTQVYLGAIEAWRGDLVGRTWRWTRISNKPGQDIHPDQHAIAFDPVNPAIVYIGNDGGLYRSSNRGGNWTSLNNGLAITEIEYTAHDPGDARWLFGGTQDNGSIRYRGSRVWDHAADGDGGDCSVNRINPNTVYHSYYGMGMERSTQKGDFGSFGWVGPNVPSGYSRLFYPPMESNGNTIAQAGQSVFVSRNNGSNWTEVNLPGNVVASAMYMPTSDAVFVGTSNGSIFRLRWSGSAWAIATLTSPRNAWISDLFVDSQNQNRMWATSSAIGGGRVFLSTDGGSNWTDRSAGLPNLPINAVIADPWNRNRVWVAADLGVYETRNSGVSWVVHGWGLPNVLVADLLFHPHARLLRAGTRNRGVWEIPVDGEMANPIVGRQWTGSLAPRETRRWFTFNWPATWHIIWTVMPTTVQSGGPQLSWKVQTERANSEYVTYWISVTNHTNQTVSFEGRYAILSRY